MNEDIKNTAMNNDELEEMQNVSENQEDLAPNEEDLSPQDSEVTEDVNEWQDKYVRLVAEFDNYKKRTNKEKLELIQFANRDLMLSLLEVLDDVDRAQGQIDNDQEVEAMKEGVQLVFNKFRKTLTDKGLKPYDSQGENFDVEMHEAITEIPAPSDDMKGKVVDEVQKGYYLNDKLLRHAKVVVGK